MRNVRLIARFTTDFAVTLHDLALVVSLSNPKGCSASWAVLRDPLLGIRFMPFSGWPFEVVE